MSQPFYNDAYLKNLADTPIVAVLPELHGVVAKQSIFFARGGGQPGDVGSISTEGGTTIPVLDTIKAPDAPADCCLLLSQDFALPALGDTVQQTIDWSFRYPVMQMHTGLHLLCASLPFGVTGGLMTPHKSRLDFDTSGEPMPDKLEIANRINELIKANLPVESLWMDWSVLDENPDIVRTLKVQPPRSNHKLRMVQIGQSDSPVDLQPCGGTHVRSTGEIPTIEVLKIENKGQHNRRVSITFAAP